MNELLRPMASIIGDHDLVYRILVAIHVPLAGGLVDVVDDWPHLEDKIFKDMVFV